MWRMTIGNIPTANARRAADSLALLDTGRRYTWAEVDERTNSLAHALGGELGVQRGEVVGILADNCVEHPELAYAASKAGAIYTGLNTRHHPREMSAQCLDAGLSVLFVGPGFEEQAGQVAGETGAKLIGVNGAAVDDTYDDVLGSGSPAPLRAHDDVDAPYNLSYTSGTTGEPKGAMISSRNMLAFVRSLGWVSRTVPSDRHLVNLPMFHAGGHFATIHPGFYGLPTVILTRPDPAETLAAIAEHDVTTFIIVPVVMRMLVEHLEANPSAAVANLRMVVYGSNPIPEELLRRFARLVGCSLAQIGGMGTEGGVGLALSPEQHIEALEEPELSHRLLSCGTVQPGVEMRLVDEHDNDVTDGEPGEMLFRGDSFVSGYWKRPEANAEVWRGGWFHSGDIGVRDADGFVSYVDRKSGRIKTGAETVYASEVQNVIRQMDGVREVSVVGVQDATWGEAVWAVIEPDGSVSLDADSVRLFVRGHLAGYKVPKQVLLVDLLPRTAVGKVAVGQVKEMCAEAAAVVVTG